MNKRQIRSMNRRVEMTAALQHQAIEGVDRAVLAGVMARARERADRTPAKPFAPPKPAPPIGQRKAVNP